MKTAFVKIYDHAEDSGMDKLNLYEEAPKLQLMIPIFFARFISQNLIAVDTMKSTRRCGLLGIIGRTGSMGMFLLVNLAPLLRL